MQREQENAHCNVCQEIQKVTDEPKYVLGFSLFMKMTVLSL